MSAPDDNHDTHDTHEPALLPEPHTPMWLPALGALLFLIGGVWWASANASAPKPAPDTSATASAASSAPAAPPARKPAGHP